MKMTEKQTDIFNQLSATFTSDTITRWEAMVVEWNNDPKNSPNPYREPASGNYLALDVLFYLLISFKRNNFTGCSIRVSKGRGGPGCSWQA
jgi:hypothetical protein